MLQEIGVESYYFIINSGRGAVTENVPPHLAFDHVILAIRIPPGVEGANLLALSPQPTLGTLLFFDPTDPFTAFGRLAGPLQSSYGLLVTPDGGQLLKSPQLPTDSTTVQRTANMTLDDTERCTVMFTKSGLATWQPCNAVPCTPRRATLIRSGQWSLLYPARLPTSESCKLDVTLPRGYEVDELPPPVDVDYGFASYHSKTQSTGATLSYTRIFEIKEVSIPVAEAARLKELYRIINNDERMVAILKRSQP
jgi:hypothetical protein